MSSILLALLVLAKIIGFLMLATIALVAGLTARYLYEQRRLRRPAARSTSGRDGWRRPSAVRSSGPMKTSHVGVVVPMRRPTMKEREEAIKWLNDHRPAS